MFNDNNTNIVSAIASTTKTDYFKNKMVAIITHSYLEKC